MNQVIKIVQPTETFTGSDGQQVPKIKVIFKDGSEATNYPGKHADEAHKALEALVNLDCDFELEPKPDFQARKQYKLTNYPGKRQGSGGGKKEWKDNSPSIEAQNALNNAVEFVVGMQRFFPAASEIDVFMRYVEEYAPRMHAVTQKLKNGATDAKPVAAPAAALGPPAGEPRSSSLPERPPPVGAAAASWEEQEARISGGSAGGEAAGSSESISEAARTVAEEGSTGEHVGPSTQLEELWQEAAARDLTHARVVTILRKAGQPIEGWEDVDERQLRSILGVTGVSA